MIQTAASVDSARLVVNAHHNYTLAGLIATIVCLILVIVVLMRHKGWDAIATVPTTNLRIIVSISLFAAFNLSIIIVGFITGSYPPEGIVTTIDGAILIAQGLDVGQFFAKRSTTDQNTPSQQNVQSGLTQGPAQSPPAPLPTPVTPPAQSDVPIVPATPAVPLEQPIVPSPQGPRAQLTPPMGSMQAALTGHKFSAGD